MPDDTKPQAAEQPLPTTPAASEKPADESSEEVFDRERAMATIRKLREQEKRAKELERMVAEYEAREKKRKEAELSEVDRLKNKLTETESALSELKTRHTELARRRAIELLAMQPKWGKHKRPFLKPEQAYALADLSGITEQDGRLVGVEEALQKLADENENLLDTPRTAMMPPTNASAANTARGAADKRQELFQRFPRLKPG